MTAGQVLLPDEGKREGDGRGEGDAGAAPPSAGGLRILESGPLVLIEDLGRHGFAAIGAGRSGALDRASLRLANRIVGNPESAAGLEILVGAFSARFESPAWFALTGARGGITLDGRPIEPDAAIEAAAGQILALAPASRGLRYYLALRGGIDVEAELGSRSRDVLAGLGPEPLRAGQRVPLGASPHAPIPPVDLLTVGAPTDGPVTVLVAEGPRSSWFTPASIGTFFETEWTVSSESNRVGARLEAGVRGGAGGSPVFERVVERELPSEAMIAGAIQVPPSGVPTVLLADHPVTGGYPVIAVVTDASLDTFAQLRPGHAVRFRHAR